MSAARFASSPRLPASTLVLKLKEAFKVPLDARLIMASNSGLDRRLATAAAALAAAAAALALYRRRRTTTYSLRPENALPANQLAPKQLEEPSDPDRLARRIETVLRRRTARVIVVMERLCDGHNFSAAFRTCEALGVQHVWLVQPPRGDALYLSRAAGKRMNDMAYSSEVDARNAAREQMSKTELAAAGYKDGTIVRVTPCLLYTSPSPRD